MVHQLDFDELFNVAVFFERKNSFFLYYIHEKLTLYVENSEKI